MKKLLLSACFLFLLCANTSIAQGFSGLENIIVEKYYISEANDTLANASGGALPVGSVTYRIYVDMQPGYIFQAAYGVPGHELRLETTTGFFNNTDRGNTTPTYTKNHTRLNTVILDSWLSVGAACAGYFGVEKSADDGVNTTVNNFSPQVIQSANPLAGIPVSQQDGLLVGNPMAVTFVGIDAPLLALLNNTNTPNTGGMVFSTSNGSWASLNGSMGPDTTTNKVLIAQITTDGVFSFKLNIQIRSAAGVVENYVAESPVGSEVQFPGLTFNSSLLTAFDYITKMNAYIKVYPNPAAESVRIQVPACKDRYADTGNYISILGISGNEIKRVSLQNLSDKSSTEEVHVEELVSGIYFLSMRVNGTQITRKFIKQ